MDPVYPNLVLAGFPKCGTSSVFEWLCLHPEVCGSIVKETHFLRDEPQAGAVSIHTHGLEAYGGFFRPEGHHRVIMEATPNYATEETPVSLLAGLPGPPRILFVVREPGARLLSQYRFLKYNLRHVPEEVRFEEWLETDVGRRHVALSRYQDHLARWAAKFPRERLKVMVFEDLVRDPVTAMGALCDWLGLDGAVFREIDLTPRNITQAMRHPRLQKLAQRLRSHVPGGLVNRFLPLWYRLVAHPPKPPRQEDVALMQALRGGFTEDNAVLAADFGLDLTAWSTA